MKKEELKIVISISSVVSMIIGGIYIWIKAEDMNLQNIFRAVSYGLSISTFFWAFYFSKGWKWSMLDKIFYRPNLNGTWSGVLISDWKNPTGQATHPKEFYIVIRQSFLRIHFTTFTDDFIGLSYSETFYLNKNKGIKNIAYMYIKDTTQQGDNDILQEGAAELRYIESDVKT